MGTSSIHFDSWSLTWRDLWRRFTPGSERRDCIHARSAWRHFRRKPVGTLMQGSWYCADQCLEPALADTTHRLRSASRRTPAPHRIPLGLLLLSRQQLTVDQLRRALAAQRTAGRGKIGEWLLALGFATEQQVTAALARQWSCPVLRPSSFSLGSLGSKPSLQIPATLLESCVMLPLDYVESTATLHVAFGEGIDYSVLYALEQMLGCRTEACLAVPSLIRSNLQSLSGHRGDCEVVFDRVSNAAEFARIIRSYCIRVSASEIRMASCGAYLWVRLLRPSSAPLDLVLRSPLEASTLPPLSAMHAAVAF